MNKIINELIKLSNKALENDDVPVSCIITQDNKIISKAYNKKVKNNDPLAHAEILCIKKAAKKLKTNNLNDCEMYCLLYPCGMCREVINEVRIKNVFYILENEKTNNQSFCLNKLDVDSKLKNELSKKISTFFKNKR